MEGLLALRRMFQIILTKKIPALIRRRNQRNTYWR